MDYPRTNPSISTIRFGLGIALDLGNKKPLRRVAEKWVNNQDDLTLLPSSVGLTVVATIKT